MKRVKERGRSRCIWCGAWQGPFPGCPQVWYCSECGGGWADVGRGLEYARPSMEGFHRVPVGCLLVGQEWPG